MSRRARAALALAHRMAALPMAMCIFSWIEQAREIESAETRTPDAASAVCGPENDRVRRLSLYSVVSLSGLGLLH